MIQDYASLKTAIGDWLLRPDLEQVIPQFINLAEASFNRRLRLRTMVKQTILVVRNGHTALPPDFLEIKKVQWDNPARVLDYVPPLQLATLQTSPARFYSIMGNHLILDANTFTGTLTPEQLLAIEDGGFLLWDDFVAPDGTITDGVPLGVAYYGRIKPLGPNQETNDLLSVAPDIYLWGSLMQTAPYLKEDSRIAIWKGLFDQAIEEQRLADDRAEHGSTALVMRQRFRRAY
jgi:hypothetical protein